LESSGKDNSLDLIPILGSEDLADEVYYSSPGKKSRVLGSEVSFTPKISQQAGSSNVVS